jgi:hypothetical protein
MLLLDDYLVLYYLLYDIVKDANFSCLSSLIHEEVLRAELYKVERLYISCLYERGTEIKFGSPYLKLTGQCSRQLIEADAVAPEHKYSAIYWPQTTTVLLQ